MYTYTRTHAVTIAVLYSEKHEYNMSEYYFKKAIAINPDHPRLLANYGSSLSAQYRFDEARASYLRYAEGPALGPGSFDLGLKTGFHE